MNNQCRIHAVPTVSLFCQLLREHNENHKHGFHAILQNDIHKIREMVLVGFNGNWTLSLCFLCLFCNMVFVKGLNSHKNKESFFLSDDNVFQKHYRFEDFFWTGSGDGPVTEELFNNYNDTEISVVEASDVQKWRTTTVFHTTTILFATVYPNSEGCIDQICQPEISLVETGSIDFSLPTFPASVIPDILPSPTQNIHPTEIASTETQFSQKGSETDTNAFDSSITPKVSPPRRTNVGDVPGSEFPGSGPKIYNVTNTTVFPQNSLDKKYWVLSILRSESFSTNLDLILTENKLASLYKKAFNRRQEKQFGNGDFRKEQKIIHPVTVKILNVTNQGSNLELLYYVTAGGKPVPAISAANDMRLLTASEVIAELGYPILTKAEPYMKNLVPLGARVNGRTRDTWLLIGSVIAAILLLIILAALFAFGLSKKRSGEQSASGISNRKQVFEEEGSSNLGFEAETDSKATDFSERTRKTVSKSGESKVVHETTGTTVKFTERERRGSTTSSSCSGSSEASLVRLRHQQKRREQRKEERDEKLKTKPKPRMRRIDSSDHSSNFKRSGYIHNVTAISKNTFDEITTEGCDDLDYSPRLAKSPTSYLSMPSVRAFPRGTKIPEPLNKVLEPTSMRHLDADSDSPNEFAQTSQNRYHEVNVEQICEVKNKFVQKKALTRHASLEGDDPGFIGPVVWSKHCQKINEGISDTINADVEIINVGRMRKRFNELLDDALSMFGSRNGSPEGNEVTPVRQIDNRVHSAVVRPASVTAEETGASRPKTTGSKRPQSSIISGPRGAWETPSCSTLARPVSAGIFRKSSPTIDKNLIYVNSDLPPSDPAIPLIAAIKNELKKFENPSCNNT